MASPARFQSTASIDGLRIRRLTELADLQQLVPDWDELLNADSVGAPFRSAAWLIPWWQHFGGGGRLNAYTVWRGSSLVGLLPTYQVRTRFGGWQLRLLGDRGVDSDYLGVIARADDEAAVADFLARCLVTSQTDLAFDGLVDHDVLLDALQRAAADVRASWTRHVLGPCPFLAVERAGGYADWLAARPWPVASRLAASRRWLDRQPGMRLDVLTRQADLVGAAPEFWRLHHARWAAEGGSDAIYNAETDAFHTASLAALAERGWARMYLLYVAGEPCAGLFGFAHGRHFSYYQAGFDPNKFRRRSLGMVVLNAALQDAFDSDLAEFDFLRGDEPYKRQYASAARVLVRIHIASGPRARGSLLIRRTVATARAVLREVVPVSVVRWARRLGRARRQWRPPSE